MFPINTKTTGHRVSMIQSVQRNTAPQINPDRLDECSFLSEAHFVPGVVVALSPVLVVVSSVVVVVAIGMLVNSCLLSSVVGSTFSEFLFTREISPDQLLVIDTEKMVGHNDVLCDGPV